MYTINMQYGCKEYTIRALGPDKSEFFLLQEPPEFRSKGVEGKSTTGKSVIYEGEKL